MNRYDGFNKNGKEHNLLLIKQPSKKTLTEKLLFKRDMLRMRIAKDQNDLDAVEYAIKTLRDNPDIGAFISALEKADIL